MRKTVRFVLLASGLLAVLGVLGEVSWLKGKRSPR
jgi:hypothetical protein